MKRQEHLLIGTVAFVIYSYIFYVIIKISMDGIAYAFIAAVIGSIIPDILEAPTNWMHRGLAHSKRALKLTGKILAFTSLIGIFFSFSYIISSFFLGYVFHLLADATTKVGLPD
jgi:membrane-bound metal-dependent hydrolase YbcI (DUF457 family)